jgi:hypothetical protein
MSWCIAIRKNSEPWRAWTVRDHGEDAIYDFAAQLPRKVMLAHVHGRLDIERALVELKQYSNQLRRRNEIRTEEG